MSFNKTDAEAELEHWFFEVYLNHWIEADNGVRWSVCRPIATRPRYSSIGQAATHHSGSG